MNKFFVCGDTHGIQSDTKKLRQKMFPEQKDLTKEDVLFQLGDFGWIYYYLGENKEQEYWLNWLSTKKYTLAVIPGNHENYDVIFSLPIIEKWGGKVRVLKTKERFGEGEIYFLERGEIYTINNKTFWIFGGALSNDRKDRILGKGYWEQELPTKEDYMHGISSLEKVNWKVDYILTHTMPKDIIEQILDKDEFTEAKFEDPVAEYFNEIYKKTTFQQWHSGHLHEDKTLEYSNKVFKIHYKKEPYELI